MNVQPNHLSVDQIRRCLANPQRAIDELDRLDSEESLLAFVRLTWPVLEPRRAFMSGWAIAAIAEHLEAVVRGEITRLLINVPPGTSKSSFTNVFLPAWCWGPLNRSDLRFIGISYSERLTIRDNRRCRNLIASELFQRLWGDRFQLAGDQNQKIRFDTNHGGFKLATSIGGSALGERGDVVVLDDPNDTRGDSEAKREAVLQFFGEVLPTRLNDPGKSGIVVIQQRTHERDVSGLILASELGYEHLCIPMRYEHDHPYAKVTSIGWQDPRRVDGELMWPERFSEEYLAKKLEPELSSFGGNFAIAGQLQQRPAPRGGGMFKRSDFILVDARPEHVTARVRGWDLAASTGKAAAFTVGVLLAMGRDRRVYVEDVVRLRGSPHEVEQAILTAAKRDGPLVIQDLPQDPGQAGLAQVSALAALLHGFVSHFSPESGSKADRARPLAAQVEAANVSLVRGPWNDVFMNEASVFPNGTFMDQVDAASRAYAKLLQRGRRSESIVGPIMVSRGTLGLRDD